MFESRFGKIALIGAMPISAAVPSFIAVVFFVYATNVSAQFNPFLPPQQIEGSGQRSLRQLPVNPLALSALQRAQFTIEKGDVAGGLEGLQTLLEETDDFFDVNQDGELQSFQQKIEAVIRNHQADYERLYGSAAEQLLEEAVTGQDYQKMTELVRRFRLTAAGQKGATLWSRLSADLGDPEAATRLAALTLLDSRPEEESFDEVNRYLSLSQQASTIEAYLQKVTGTEDLPQFNFSVAKVDPIPIPIPGAAPLYDWQLPHGNTSHAGRAPFAPAMFADVWEQPLIDKYDFFLGAPQVEQARLQDALKMASVVDSQVRSRTRRTAFPAGRALIVGKHVIVPGYASIKSFDLQTGEIDGVGVKIDQSFEYLHEYSATPSLMNNDFREKIRKLFFSLRGWRDLTSASLSSDGDMVYAISDCQVVGSVRPEYLSRSSQRHELLPQAFNQLHAFELNAGLRNKWSVGSVSENTYYPFESDEGLNREIFFYGAPLTLGRQLFVIGEERAQIQLYEIDRETGAILWSIALHNTAKDIVRDDMRRLAGLTPAYANGLLICPTGEGVLTAVDPLLKRVAWTYHYEKSRQMVLNQFMFRRGMRNREQTVEQSIEDYLTDDRWFDHKVTVAGQYVVHTPPDSEELICLNGLDGTRLWQDDKFRLRSLSLGGVFDSGLIIVGQREISLLNLADGNRRWACSIPEPSGRGVRMEGHFVQPLASGEVLFINLKDGRLAARSVVPGQKMIGNLTAAHGRLIANNGTSVVAFQTLPEVEAQLAAVETDAERQSLEGELSLQRGNREEGIKQLEAIDPAQLSERGRRVLVWAKLDGLQREFDQYRKQQKQIEELLTDDHQRFVFRKAMAEGLKASGETQSAFSNYLLLYSALAGEDSLHDFDGVHELSYSRWVLAELVELYESASEDEQQTFDQLLNQWLAETVQDEVFVRFLKNFVSVQFDDTALLARLNRIEPREEFAGALNTILNRLAESGQSKVMSSAYQLLAKHALLRGDGLAADRYLTQWEMSGDQAVKSVQAIEGIRNDERNAAALNSVPVWPTHVEKSDKSILFAKSSRTQIPVFGPVSAPLNGWSFFVNAMGSQIDVFDQHGRRQCQISTGVISNRIPVGASLGRYVSLRGHRALIVLVDRFLLVDFQGRRDLPRIVANEMLITEDQNPYGTETFVSQEQRPRVGFRTFRSPAPIGTPAGNVGPLGETTLCYGRGTELIAINPDSGKLVWKRHDLEMGSEIFADEQYVLTLIPGTRSLRVFHTIDGQELDAVEVPAGAIDSVLDRQNGDWGRYFPVLQRDEEELTFSLVDPVKNELKWEYRTEAKAAWSVVEGRDIAFLTPAGEFTLLNGMTGVEIAQLDIPVTQDFRSVTVKSFDEHWLVIPGSGFPLRYEFSYPSEITRLTEVTVQGTVVSIDRNTKEVVWSQEIEDQKMTTQFPPQWPVLFFGKSYGRTVNGLILNRLTGEVVFEEEMPYDRSWIHWQSTTQPMRVLIGYGRKSIAIDCLEDVSVSGQQDQTPESPVKDDEPELPPQNE